MRLAILLLLACCSLAQGRPDFSGIFLRTETRTHNEKGQPASPRILEIRQTTDEFIVTAIQNGETASAHFLLEGKKGDKIQTRLTSDSFVVTGPAQKGIPFSLPVIPAIPAASPIRLEERWTLSGDLQQLSIRTKPSIGSMKRGFTCASLR